MTLAKSFILTVLTLAIGVSSASADFLNTRPVLVSGTALQSFLDAQDGGLNAATDQSPIAIWSTNTSNTSSFTILLELNSFSTAQEFGIYNFMTPWIRYEIFDANSGVGWYALATFNSGGNPGKLLVSRFNYDGDLVSQTIYNDVWSTDFGFYLDTSATPGGGLHFGEDNLNGGDAHCLAFLGTGENAGLWFLVWEGEEGMGNQEYADFVVFAEGILIGAPVPVRPASWGNVKSRFGR